MNRKYYNQNISGMKSANPYLYFPGNTEEAFNHYKSIFGGDFLDLLRFRDLPENSMGVEEKDLDKVAHVALPLGKTNILMGTDEVESMGTSLTLGTNFYITLEPESSEEADEVFNALSADGKVDMPLQKTDWAEKYGICTDKFGIQWMINYGEV